MVVLFGACAAAPVNQAHLRRALTPPQWELTVGTAHPTSGSVEGAVLDHRAIAGEGRVRQLTLEVLAPGGVEGQPLRALLRYALPGGRALPVDVGTSVTIDLHRADDAGGGTLTVTDGTGLRAALGDGPRPAEQRVTADLVIAPSLASSYRESMRRSGFCEATVEHRAALVTVGAGTTSRRTLLHTGESRLLGSSDHPWEVVLADHSVGVAEGCPDLDLGRFSYVVLAAP